MSGISMEKVSMSLDSGMRVSGTCDLKCADTYYKLAKIGSQIDVKQIGEGSNFAVTLSKKDLNARGEVPDSAARAIVLEALS